MADYMELDDGRLADLYDGHCITGAPDMVIDVVSPATASRDRHTKLWLYADSGNPWLLLVEPKAQVVDKPARRRPGRCPEKCH